MLILASLAVQLSDAALQGDHASHMDFLDQKAEIKIVINPEARVSVTRLRDPAYSHCEQSPIIGIFIKNEAKLSTKLFASISEDGRDFRPLPPILLSGSANEHLEFQLPKQPGPVYDITIAFDVGPGTRDVGGRSETHLLIRCH